jgi:hypothetical protein
VRLHASAVAAACLLVQAAVGPSSSVDGTTRRSIGWADVAPLASRLEPHGVAESTFASYVERLRRANVERVREGDLDHLVFYLLQSTRFTTRPPIEPALSAKALVDSLEPSAREAFLKGVGNPAPAVPEAVRARVAAVVRALDKESEETTDTASADPRLVYFRELVDRTFAARRQREAAISAEYLRVMRFVYEKEFVAQQSTDRASAVSALYQSRGLSTDTAVEAGFLVHLGLAVSKALEPDRRLRRVLVVGPGLDLAPRTALVEDGPPESYQPWAVIDGLVSLGLSRFGELDVVAADINPRVIGHLRRARAQPPSLTLVSGIRETDSMTLSSDYRDYFMQLGRAIGTPNEEPAGAAGHLRRKVRVHDQAARALHAETLDIVTERFDGAPFDLIVATNILPYFDDASLTLALTNIAGMLAPAGIFLHNEPRPLVREVTNAVGLPFEQSRHAIIATVRGAPSPLYDSVFLHRRRS